MFKAYDIRGRVGKDFQISDYRKLGFGIGKWLQARSINNVLVGYDTRPTSSALLEQLLIGLTAAGLEVVVQSEATTTPLTVFSMRKLHLHACVMITASHNPWEDNGLKFYLNKDEKVYPVCGLELESVKTYMQECCHTTPSYKTINCINEYIEFLVTAYTGVKNVVWNANYGGGSKVIEKLARKLNHESMRLYESADDYKKLSTGPDCMYKDNVPLIEDKIVLSLDGDGDRLQVCKQGDSLTAEEVMLVFPKRSLVHDVHLSQACKEQLIDCKLHEVKVGHVHVQKAMQEFDADVGMEASGHFFFKELGTMDDALYAGMKFLQNVNKIQKINGFISGVIRLPVQDNEKAFQILMALCKQDAIRIESIDGLKCFYTEGWLLIRKSNTQSCLSLMYEGYDKRGYDALGLQVESMIKFTKED